jgi:hypothetical protein
MKPGAFFLYLVSCVFALAPGVLCPPEMGLTEAFQTFGWMFCPASLFAFAAFQLNKKTRH